MFVSCFGWLLSMNAPLLPVIYTQFVRIKAISSHFTQHTFMQANRVLKSSLPEGIYLAFVKPVIGYLAKAENPDPKETKVTAEANKKSSKDNESSSEEEPRTYEINEASVPEATYEDLD